MRRSKVSTMAFFLVVSGITAGIGGTFPQAVQADTQSTKEIMIEGKMTTVPEKGNVWIKANGYTHFVKDGQLVKGWKRMTKAEGEKTDHYSFFDNTYGRLYTGWRKMGKAEGEKTEHWSYFGDNGWLRTGWQRMGKGTSNPDGNNVMHWSYFGNDGWLRTGWNLMGKGTSNPDGNAQKHWSYFGNNGWLRTGWQTLGKGTSDPDGNSEKHKSYFGGNGWLVTGLKNINGTLYSFDGRGWLISEDNEMLTKAQSYSSPTGYLILVNRDKCRTAVFTGGKNNWNYTKYWICSVGKPSSYTVTGVFKTGQKGLYFDTGTNGRCWYYTRFYGSFLFHSIIYDRSFDRSGIVDGTLGAKVSHGCVRLRLEDAKWIYDVIPSNTTVVVYN